MSENRHLPVLVDEVIEALAPHPGGTYVDGTFGLGGYSSALLDHSDCHVIGIDRDPDARPHAEQLKAAYGDRLRFITGRFGAMGALLADHGVGQVDGVTLDLGVSSPQLDQPERGFSFRFDGPLDMRMGRDGETAADLVNTLGDTELADVIHQLGEERHARRIARAIVAARTSAPITTTAHLAAIVRSVVRPGRDGIDPATRTFMALRMRVNDELGELSSGLGEAEHVLAPGGRLAVVTFHSLEDRLVKTFLRARAGKAGEGVSRHMPDIARAPAHAASFRLITKRPITASADEIARNPRARSAKLRVGERTDAAPWPMEAAA